MVEILHPPEMSPYIGRFAPSPTGRLHLGSLFCAMASFVDARAHGGAWAVRIEDIDPPRDMPGADRDIIETLAAFGMASDIPVIWQSQRLDLYAEAFARLDGMGLVYGCACSRADIALADRLLGLAKGIYPGTCRNGTGGRPARSWRFRTVREPVSFTDRMEGPYTQNVEAEVGDFIVRRADGRWSYQLAVVVDDAAQGITDIVRGRDLLDNTPRQMLLQRALGYPHPRWMHIPLILDENGEKLSKQRAAMPVSADSPLALLEYLWPVTGLPDIGADSLAAFWDTAARLWAERYGG